MPHRVISAFRVLSTGQLVEPGQDCPELDAETTERLIGAGCLEAAPTGHEAAPTGHEAAPTPGARRRRRGGAG